MTKKVYRNNEGKIHRDDGPALIINKPNVKIQLWYIDGRNRHFDDWCIELNKSEEEIIILKLKYNST